MASEWTKIACIWLSRSRVWAIHCESGDQESSDVAPNPPRSPVSTSMVLPPATSTYQIRRCLSEKESGDQCGA